MSGTTEGAKQSVVTNTTKYGTDFYKRIGQLGGMRRVPKGFAINRELAREAGRKGGTTLRRPSRAGDA